MESSNKSLYNAIRRLADQSNKSYVILSGIEEEYSIIHCNEAYLKLTDYTYEELINLPYFMMLVDTHLHVDIQKVEENLKDGITVQTELHHLRKSKASFYSKIESLPFQNHQDETIFVLQFIEDITCKKMEGFLHNLEKQVYSAIERESPFEQKMKIICNELDEFYSPLSFTNIFIKSREDKLLTISSDYSMQDEQNVQFKEHHLTEFYAKVMLETTSTFVELSQQQNLIEEYKQAAIDKDMNMCCHIPIVNQKKKVIGLIAVYYKYLEIDYTVFQSLFQKISNLISLAYTYAVSQHRILELAYTDVTTGLANRHQFMNDLEEYVTNGNQGVIKLIQPGEYANVVELYGHKAGDELMRQIANRLNENNTIKNCKIARFSSSSLIVSHLVSDEEKFDYDEHVHELMQVPYILGDKQVYISLKTGVAPFYETVTAEDVLRHADIALSYAKKQPGSHSEMFTEESNEALERKMAILNHLTLGLKRHEFVVYLQPKVNLKSGKISSFEALARWFSPELGRVSPVDFISIAENAGKIREIDIQILEQVLKWIQSRQRAGKKSYRVAVNVSPEHFYHPTFVEDICDLVKAYYVDPHDIIIEVTESIGLVDLNKANQILNHLKLLGFSTSVDDFGIGFSSLSYLQKLPFNELKIDRSFIMKLHEAGTEAVVRLIIQLAHYLNMDVVAEGIETEEQATLLREIGCNNVQGFLYYKPAPLTEIDKFLL